MSMTRRTTAITASVLLGLSLAACETTPQARTEPAAARAVTELLGRAGRRDPRDSAQKNAVTANRDGVFVSRLTMHYLRRR